MVEATECAEWLDVECERKKGVEYGSMDFGSPNMAAIIIMFI